MMKPLSLIVNGKFFNMEIVPVQMCVYKSCYVPVNAMILAMYADDNGIRLKCEELVHFFEKFITEDGALICNLALTTTKWKLAWLISIGMCVWYATLMTRSQALLVVAKRPTSIVSWCEARHGKCECLQAADDDDCFYYFQK